MGINAKRKGLTDAEVCENRLRYGANVLTPPVKEAVLKRFLKKFKDPLIIILLVAGFLSVGISCYQYCALDKSFAVFFEPVGIFAAIILATGLSFIFELKADKEFELLARVNDDEPVAVIRNGFSTRVPKRDIVFGDLVLLNTGDEIPADGRLLDSVRLCVDESTLTGEPVCNKTADEALLDPDATFPSNHVLRGTKVLEGHGLMQVTAVGDATENGKVFIASQIDNSVKTPLDEQLEKLGHLISKASYIIAAAVIVGRLTMYFTTANFDWVEFVSYLLQTLMIAVALIVVAVPEGLPMAVTLTLVFSMRNMLKTNNLVRRLHACETMGATTVICTDKTGTLTQNRMEVASLRFFGDASTEIINNSFAINSTARLDLSGKTPQVLGNPTEGALLLWLNGNGVNYDALRSSTKILAELPFTTERKFMATVCEDASSRRTLYVKGAPEVVYGLCNDSEGVTATELNDILATYQKQAMRTLGFAYAHLNESEPGIYNDAISASRLTFLGVAAISDPVRTDAPEAVREVLDAGVKVKIVTGDTPGTAIEIGRRLGLWDDNRDTAENIITGENFAALTDKELLKIAGDLKIIARARPMDKKRLVDILQQCNEVVAVTGDGTNDAPALKAAHVGLSMGDGTSVAKEASDITILDNSFASIGRAVMWGRSLYRNIQRFVLFQLTVNVQACLIVLAGAFLSLQSPLTVTQMLWVNLIMDTFAAVALASLPPSRSVMRQRPRPRSEFIITRGMRRYILGSGTVLFCFLFVFLYYLEHVELTSLTQIFQHPVTKSHPGLSPYELSLFFTTFVFLQFWNMFNARAYATGRSALRLKGCRGFILISTTIVVGQVLIVNFGNRFFNVVPIKPLDWLIIIAVTSLVLWIGECTRIFSGNHSRKKRTD